MALQFKRFSDPQWKRGGDYSVMHVDDPSDLLSKRFSKRNREAYPARYREHMKGVFDGNPEKVKTFFGGKPPAIAKILRGQDTWAEGLSRVEELRPAVGGVRAQYSFKKRFRRGDEGSELDIFRFFDGDYDTMWTRLEQTAARRRGGTKIVSFVQAGADSAFVEPGQFIWNGIALSALADILEAAGIRTWITMAWGGRDILKRRPKNHRNRWMILVDLKLPDQPLDLEHLVNWSAHPGAFRVGVFRAYYSMKGQVDGGLGYPMKMPELLPYLRQQLDRDFIEVPRMYSKQEAEDFLRKTLGDLGLLDREDE